MECSLCGEKDGIREARCIPCGADASRRSLAWFVGARASLENGHKILDLSTKLLPFLSREGILHGAKLTALFSPNSEQVLRLTTPHRVLRMDPTKLSLSDHSLDFIFAEAVFHHIRSDFQAMSEAHRCLKNNGIAILGETITRELTARKLDTEGEHWDYGEDYFERLESAGFFVKRITVRELADPATIVKFQLQPEFLFTLGFKFRETMEGFLQKWT